MKNYLLTLLFVSAITGGIVYLSAGSCYERHLRYLCTLLTLLALLSPLPSLLGALDASSFPELSVPSDPSSEYGILLKDQTEQRLNEELTYKIKGSCGLLENEFTLDCSIDLNDEEALLTLRSITVNLYTLSATLKREQIRSELLSVCPVIEFKEEIGRTIKEEAHDEYTKEK